MKNFFKQVLAVITGFIIISILITLTIFIISAIVLVATEKTQTICKNSILYMSLNYEIPERTSSGSFDISDIISDIPNKKSGLNDILDAIDKAGKNKNIKGLFLELSACISGYGTMQEIRNAILEFKKSGKFVIAYGDYMNQKAYYLATAADKVYVNPSGIVELSGLRLEVKYYKELLDKCGIEAELIRAGTYKTAAEPFVRSNMSKENREQLNYFLDKYWSQMKKEISESRNVGTDTIDILAEHLTITRSLEDAVKHRMIDGLRYRDEVIDEIKERCGIDSKDEIKLTKITKMINTSGSSPASSNKIAIIYGQGSIDMFSGSSSDNSISSKKMVKALKKARNDSSVKAVVLRINSGGGSSLASDIIWREVELTAKEKPLIASMGSMAASGGYYILLPAHKIFTHELTLTGSIGVWGLMFNAQNLMNNKLGINIENVMTNSNSDAGSLFRPMNPAEKEVFSHQINSIYFTFKKRVSDGRRISEEEVEKIAKGRIWCGKDAIALGLADTTGGLFDAIAEAAKEAELKDYELLELPKAVTPLETIMEIVKNNTSVNMFKKELGENYRFIKIFEDIKTYYNPQMRTPAMIDIY